MVKLDSLKVEVTEYGFRIVGFKESILPLGRLARIKYKKKLKSRRLLKKYAKILLESALESYLKEALDDHKKRSSTVST